MARTERTWNNDEAETLLVRFEQAERPARPLNVRELIQGKLMPSIQQKLRAGWTYEELCAELEKLGVSIAKSTLKDYVKRARPRPGGNKRRTNPSTRRRNEAARSPVEAENASPSADTKSAEQAPFGIPRKSSKRFTALINDDV